MTSRDGSIRRFTHAIVNCVACRGTLAHRNWVALSTVTLRECRDCGTLTAVPRPTSESQTALHDRVNYFDHPYFEKRRRDNARIEGRCRRVFASLDGLAPAPEGTRVRLLDVGCDTGAFLQTASRLYRVQGIGLDVSARAVARAVEHGIQAVCGTLESAPASLGPFDLITAIDVIEHVADPTAFLRAVGLHLTPSGACYIETPNPESIIYRLGRFLSPVARGSASLERLFPAEHVHYFSARGLRAVAAAAGLTIARTGTRRLSSGDLAVNVAVGRALTTLQLLDRANGTEILRWAVCGARQRSRKGTADRFG